MAEKWANNFVDLKLFILVVSAAHHPRGHLELQPKLGRVLTVQSQHGPVRSLPLNHLIADADVASLCRARRIVVPVLPIAIGTMRPVPRWQPSLEWRNRWSFRRLARRCFCYTINNECEVHKVTLDGKNRVEAAGSVLDVAHPSQRHVGLGQRNSWSARIGGCLDAVGRSTAPIVKGVPKARAPVQSVIRHRRARG